VTARDRTDKLLIGLICAFVAFVVVVVVGADIIGAVLLKMKPRSAFAKPSTDTAPLVSVVPVAAVVLRSVHTRSNLHAT